MPSWRPVTDYFHARSERDPILYGHYDFNTRELTTVFRKGAVVVYFSVTKEWWYALKSAPWRYGYYRHHIKAQYECACFDLSDFTPEPQQEDLNGREQ